MATTTILVLLAWTPVTGQNLRSSESADQHVDLNRGGYDWIESPTRMLASGDLPDEGEEAAEEQSPDEEMPLDARDGTLAETSPEMPMDRPEEMPVDAVDMPEESQLNASASEAHTSVGLSYRRARALRNRLTGMCMDYDFRHPERRVVMWPCHRGQNQRWYLQNTQLKSRHDDLCLDYAVHRGGHVVVWSCHFGNNQDWRFIGEAIVSLRDGKCVQPSWQSLRSGQKGGELELRACDGGRAQSWQWTLFR